jgi:peroxiredoxin Q/BCP
MKIGEKAPDFTLKDGDGNDWTLSENLGKVIVLLFYPGDNTPVCTKQLCSVRDNWDDYAETGAEIIGISTDSVESHKGFAEKYNFPFTLLSDENGEVVEKYDAKSWIPGKSARRNC